jgi:hypothetical protein
MAIQTSDLLFRLNPSSGGGDMVQLLQQMQQQREQMRLSREQFEETKRRNREDERLRQLADENDLMVARMNAQAEAEQQEAERQATLLAQRQAAGQEVAKYAAAGDEQGMLAMSPYLQSLGSGLELQGAAGGLGRYRYVPDVAADQQRESERLAQTQSYGPNETAVQSLNRLNALGYPGNEIGNLDDPQLRENAQTATDPMLQAEPDEPEFDAATADALTPGEKDMQTSAEFGGEGADVSVNGRGMRPAELPLGDPYTQALIASKFARENEGAAIRPPDEPDETGGVPSDVIDLGAIEAQTLAKLKPGLQAFTESYPETHTESAEATQRGVEGMAGLPLAKRLELYDKMRSGPDSAINQQLQLEAQKEKDSALSPGDQEALVDRASRRVQANYKTHGIDRHINMASSAQVVIDMLNDDDPLNDEQAINALMELSRNKGPQTERDADRMRGEGTMPLLGKVEAWLSQQIKGGYWTDSKKAMTGFAQRMMDEDEGITFNWLDAQRDQAGKAHSPYYAEGISGFLDTLPLTEKQLERYEKRLAEQEKAGAEAAPQPTSANAGGGSLDGELARQAGEAGLDPAKLGPVIRGESGGDPSAVSSEGARGVMQIMPSNLRAMGIDPDAYSKLSAAEQLPAALRYLKERGITKESSPEDYAMAVAAPKFIGKPDDTVVYAKGSADWKANKPWRPADGGDITVASILAHYGLRDRPSGGGEPQPETELDAEVLDILR